MNRETKRDRQAKTRVMKPEDTQELKELIEFLKENNIGEFELERDELKVKIKFAPKPGEAGSLDLAQMTQMARLFATTSMYAIWQRATSLRYANYLRGIKADFSISVPVLAILSKRCWMRSLE